MTVAERQDRLFAVFPAEDHAVLELYRCHPELGPVGTPGRGPYKIARLVLDLERVPAVREHLVRRGIREV